MVTQKQEIGKATQSSKAAQSEKWIRSNALSLALGVSEVSLNCQILKGCVPKPDTSGRFPHPQTRVWKLSKLAKWRPDIARRCEALLKTLEDHPIAA